LHQFHVYFLSSCLVVIVWFDVSNPENYLALAMPTRKRAENWGKQAILCLTRLSTGYVVELFGTVIVPLRKAGVALWHNTALPMNPAC
jgi:hypothetical protein